MSNDKPKEKDSLDYCIDFWRDAIDVEDEIDLCIREFRHIRAADDDNQGPHTYDPTQSFHDRPPHWFLFRPGETI